MLGFEPVNNLKYAPCTNKVLHILTPRNMFLGPSLGLYVVFPLPMFYIIKKLHPFLTLL